MAETKPANEAKLKAFDDLLKNINADKKFQSDMGSIIGKIGDGPKNVETFSTGSLVLDSLLGGGLAKGRVIEVFGAESSGKTTIALTTIANVQAQGGTCVFLDFENALDTSYAAKLGVDVRQLALSQPDYAEQGLNLVERLAASGMVDLIVVDSVAAMVPKAELEGDMEDMTIGLLARLLSKALRRLVSTANRSGTTVLFINQIREKIGGFSPVGVPTDTTGGRAMKFFSSQRIEIKRKQQVKDGQTVIGNITGFNIKKNKIAPPFMTGETVITFNKGINKAAELVEVGPAYGAIIKPNVRTYVTTDGEIFAKSKAEAVEALEKSLAGEDGGKLFDKVSGDLRSIRAGEIANGFSSDKAAEPDFESGDAIPADLKTDED